MFLQGSILRSSLGSTFCSLLKLYVKKLVILSNVSGIWQHIVCVCICCICCREVGRSVGRPTDRSTDLPTTHTTYTHKTICRIPETFDKITNFLTYNFSKEQNVLPKDDLRIETCRNILSVLV